MITKEKIQSLVEEILSDDMFIVEIAIGSGAAISVLVDSDTGINIDKCVEISRHIEKNLDRESEDFSLEVSSPGLGQPLKALRQYNKNIGRKVEVVELSGDKREGILKSVNNEGFELEVKSREKLNGAKTQIVKSELFPFGRVKTVKLLISFK
jgi:ribosome maturation factor RimP